MSADIISLGERGRLPWQSNTFTKDQRALLNRMVVDAMVSGAVRQWSYSQTPISHTLHMINGGWDGAPVMSFAKQVSATGHVYVYCRTGMEAPHVADDFVTAVSAARADLSEFAKVAAIEVEKQTREIAVQVTRSSFHLVAK